MVLREERKQQTGKSRQYRSKQRRRNKYKVESRIKKSPVEVEEHGPQNVLTMFPFFSVLSGGSLDNVSQELPFSTSTFALTYSDIEEVLIVDDPALLRDCIATSSHRQIGHEDRTQAREERG